MLPDKEISSDVRAIDIVNRVLSRGYIDMPDGSRQMIDYNVSLDEAAQIANVIRQHRCVTTAETGVAFGISALAICAALRENGDGAAMHFGIDPNQASEYNNAALRLLSEHKLQERFTLLHGPTHLEAPKLLEKDVRLDFAFVDGWHTFDYTLIDFFFMDKMLKPNGIIGFHDSHGPAKRKVAKFLLSHRRYIRLPFRRVPVRYWLKNLAGGAYRLNRNALYHLDRRPALCFFQKMESWEPNYDFFRRF
jgi:predicted O-methyltransferase YrrM